jgi:putative salt-induced outer membrane protein YdiY
MSNYQGRLRYDRFFSNVVSGFLQASALSDKFQGLDLRVNIDPGVSIYAINEATHQWSFDVGYDFQYEDYLEEDIEPLSLHSARVATSYVNALNESVTFKTGAEYLIALSPFEQCYYTTTTSASVRCEDFKELPEQGDPLEEVRRANWSLLGYAKLDAKVSDKFTVVTALELRHDNSPVQLNYAMNDIRTSVNLSYHVF